MFFTRMVSNFLSSKSASSSKNHKNKETSKTTRSDDADMATADKISKELARTNAKILKASSKLAAKKDAESKKNSDSGSGKDKSEKTGFMGLSRKKKSLKKRLIPLSLIDMDPITTPQIVEESTTSSVTPSTSVNNSSLRTDKLYSDIVSGGTSPPLRSTKKAEKLSPRSSPEAVAPLKVLADPDHSLFPSLSESYKVSPNKPLLPNEFSKSPRFEDPENDEAEEDSSKFGNDQKAEKYINIIEMTDRIGLDFSDNLDISDNLDLNDSSLDFNETVDFKENPFKGNGRSSRRLPGIRSSNDSLGSSSSSHEKNKAAVRSGRFDNFLLDIHTEKIVKSFENPKNKDPMPEKSSLSNSENDDLVQTSLGSHQSGGATNDLNRSKEKKYRKKSEEDLKEDLKRFLKEEKEKEEGYEDKLLKECFDVALNDRWANKPERQTPTTTTTPTTPCKFCSFYSVCCEKCKNLAKMKKPAEKTYTLGENAKMLFENSRVINFNLDNSDDELLSVSTDSDSDIPNSSPRLPSPPEPSTSTGMRDPLLVFESRVLFPSVPEVKWEDLTPNNQPMFELSQNISRDPCSSALFSSLSLLQWAKTEINAAETEAPSTFGEEELKQILHPPPPDMSLTNSLQENSSLTASLLAIPTYNFTPLNEFPEIPGTMFTDERFLFYDRLAWLGFRLAMGDKKW